ncbi:Alpha/Beta hydrolase protein [Syncephalastrum racemosum]|uniref:Alpha/Beta hydrolase protein n=1 Tax=Syncephalastrum racemosum TaxID=13706 RepID=A0A1X2HWI5_SYNRA|nr:Alpha/Beta hydrolase protein [Syncephalastrum racemosum]
MSTPDVVEEWVKAPDGFELYTKTWKTPETPKALLVLIHGFGEHITRYHRLFTYFVENGIQVHGFDQRGWGRSGEKAHSYGNNGGYDTAMNDINDAVKRTHQPGIPLFLMGHSMGGGLILNYLSRSEIYDGVQLLSGAIASAPLVTLSMPISPLRYYPLRIASNILPSFVIKAGLDPKGISHDEKEVEIFKNDPLIHDYGTLATVRGFLDAGQDLFKRASAIKTPILYSHGDIDPINKYESTVKVYENTASQDKELKTWPGLYHEPHVEKLPDREQVREYYVNWIKARASN